MANSYSQVSYGSQGNDVKELQKRLNQNGYSLDEDGIFGSKTQAAVTDFQKKNKLAVDGIVGKETWGQITGFKPTPEVSVMGTSTGNTQHTSDKPSTGAASTGTAAGSQTSFNNGGYVESDVVKQAEAMLNQQLSQKPGEYQSPWQSQLNDIMDKILNRDKFSYDLNGDALYQQYKDKYIQQGRMAMMDTMGQAQAMTGGYGNSYAQSVGQQAYQAQLQNLNDIVPELYQMALDQYNQQGQDMLNQFGIMADRESQDYSRYRDSVSDWQAEQNRLYQQYQDERSFDYSKYADGRDFDYGKYIDERNYQYQQGRDAVSDEQWQAEFDEAKRQYDQSYALSASKNSGTSSGSGGGAGGSGGSKSSGGYSYDTHGYSTAEIKALQRAAGISADGVWGPQTQKAYEAGYRPTSNPAPGGNDDSVTDLLDDIVSTGTLLDGSKVDKNTRAGQQALRNAINLILSDAVQSGEISEAEADRLRQIYASSRNVY